LERIRFNRKRFSPNKSNFSRICFGWGFNRKFKFFGNNEAIIAGSLISPERKR